MATLLQRLRAASNLIASQPADGGAAAAIPQPVTAPGQVPEAVKNHPEIPAEPLPVFSHPDKGEYNGPVGKDGITLTESDPIFGAAQPVPQERSGASLKVGAKYNNITRTQPQVPQPNRVDPQPPVRRVANPVAYPVKAAPVRVELGETKAVGASIPISTTGPSQPRLVQPAKVAPEFNKEVLQKSLAPELPTDDTAEPTDNFKAERFIITGQPGAGVSHAANVFGVIELSIDEAVQLYASEVLGCLLENMPGLPGLLATVRAWGEGQFTDKYPLTMERMLFTVQARVKNSEFGTPGFWVKLLLSGIEGGEFEGRGIAVTGLQTPDEFKTLQTLGFEHWHIMASPQVRSARGYAGKSDKLAQLFDDSVIQQISRKPQGGKLHAIWNDTNVQPPSPRIWNLRELAQ